MLYANEWERSMLEEERKLLNEVSKQKMSWRKISNLIKLNALVNANRR